MRGFFERPAPERVGPCAREYAAIRSVLPQRRPQEIARSESHRVRETAPLPLPSARLAVIPEMNTRRPVASTIVA